jgi:hypothetical protein
VSFISHRMVTGVIHAAMCPLIPAQRGGTVEMRPHEKRSRMRIAGCRSPDTVRRKQSVTRFAAASVLRRCSDGMVDRGQAPFQLSPELSVTVISSTVPPGRGLLQKGIPPEKPPAIRKPYCFQ